MEQILLFRSKDGGKSWSGPEKLDVLGREPFTVRKRQPPLGVQAIPGRGTDDGFESDFAHDRLMLDTKTGARYQGGGFRPTVQLDDGTLVTACSYRGEDNKTHLEGIRVVPYILGWTCDMDTESYRTKDARNQAAQWRPDGGLHVMDSYGGGQKFAGMCPATRLWRDEMKSWTTELVGRYGVDGVYFDFLTVHTGDCFNPDHGHPTAGGNYWTRAVHGLYEECRAAGRTLNPEFMMTGEAPAEYCIDVPDTFLSMGQGGTAAPLFMAVYHGYANVFGRLKENNIKAIELGRPWLLGFQNGWHNWEGAPIMGKPPYESFAFLGEYYKRLLKCRWEFANPYLGRGEMLRPPKVAGELPEIAEQDTHGLFTVAAVEGSVWKAPDASVGLFFLNYDEKKSGQFTWTADLAEAGMDASRKVRISRWTPDAGLAPLAEIAGGVASQSMEAQPLDIIALKLEVIP